MSNSNLHEGLSNEEKNNIKSEVIKQLKSSDINKVISDIVGKELSKNKELEKEVVEITKNVITQFYKILWTKRGFWQSSLKNKNS